MSAAVGLAAAVGRSDIVSSKRQTRRTSAASAMASKSAKRPSTSRATAQRVCSDHRVPPIIAGMTSQESSVSFSPRRRAAKQPTSPTRTYQTRSQTRAAAASSSAALDEKRCGLRVRHRAGELSLLTLPPPKRRKSPLVPITITLGLLAVIGVTVRRRHFLSFKLKAQKHP